MDDLSTWSYKCKSFATNNMRQNAWQAELLLAKPDWAWILQLSIFEFIREISAGVLVWYFAAKLFEHFDLEIFVLLNGLVSGHTLKHLAAAMVTLYVVLYFKRRTPAGS